MTAASLNDLAVDNSRVITALPFLRLDLVELVAVQTVRSDALGRLRGLPPRPIQGVAGDQAE